MKLALLAVLPAASYAFQWPFEVPFFKSKAAVEPIEAVETTPRIAIIGAGAGGSSSAFWISKAKERFGLNVEIDVYERSSYIGGRSTTVYPYNDTSLPPVELGASIFVKVNKNMWRAAEEFNFTLNDFRNDTATFGVWDGELLRVMFSNSWWDTLKLIWRYGVMSPRRANQIVDGMVKSLLRVYTADTPKWDNITTLATTLGYQTMISNTTASEFERLGVSKQYIYEIIEASTRVNYGQNADEIHMLEGAASMASSGAVSVEGGNFQVFEKFIEHSNATTFLNTPVKRLIPKKVSSNHWTLQTADGSTDYRAVIIAAPFHTSGLDVPSWLSSTIPKQPYVHLHVTLLSTKNATINPEYLNLAPGTIPPSMVLTTHENVRSGGKAPEFNSLSYHGKITDDEWTVKIFSKQRILDEWLQQVFGHVGWVYRKEWDAYPELPPTSSFPPVKLHQGLYYVNAFEPFISTMETQTLAARNVVDILLNDEFNSGICDKRIASSSDAESSPKGQPDKENYVYGWDC